MLKDTLTQSEGKARRLILSLWTPALLTAILLLAAFVACGGDSSSEGSGDRETSMSETDRETGGNGDRPQATEELEEEAEAEPTRRGLFPRPGSQPGDTAGPEATDTPAVATAPSVLGPTSAETDREVLFALYNATDGENWRKSENWLSDAPLGEWEGVETGVDGRVTTLDLSSQRLSGEIPAELSSLSDLEKLDLGENELSGEIPAELDSLSNLIILDLGENELSGEIPAWLGSLSNLELLDLRRNELSGEIPAELDSLSNLRSLNLGSNELSGEIPAWLGSLTSLKFLNLSSNDWSGEIPAEFGSLANLEFLDLGGNELSGEIPAELGNLASLEHLRLFGNELSGCVPGNLEDQLASSPAYSDLGGLSFC